MAVLPVFWAFVLLIVVFQGYKWYRIHRLISSRDATPPSLWTLALWPRTVLLLLFGAIFVWALVEWLIPHYR
jgi:hypothetical protein